MAKAVSPGNVEKELSRCINQLLLKEPFYAHVLAGTVRKFTDEIATAAVGIDNKLVLLMVNPGFFLKELGSESERTAVLKHEVLHLVFRHLFRDKIKEDPELFNIAADLVVNQYIGSWKLPDSAVTLKTFPDLNLKTEQHLEYYYEILFKLNQANQQEEKDENQGSSTPGNEEQPDKQPLNKKHPESARNLARIYGNQRHSDHSKWVIRGDSGAMTADGKPLPDNLVQGLEQTLGKHILEAASRTPAKHYGQLPGDIRTALVQIRESMKPKINWKRVLRIFSSANGRTVIHHTMKRISKRYGTRPGIRIRQFKKIAVAIDTSGSIDEPTLSQFFKEIDAISRCGAEVHVIECDSMVQNEYPYNRKKIPEVKGGGGTCFDPVFEHINHNSRLKIDACIYLTDGYAPAPKVKPHCRLLYVVTPGGSEGEHLTFGRVVRMGN